MINIKNNFSHYPLNLPLRPRLLHLLLLQQEDQLELPELGSSTSDWEAGWPRRWNSRHYKHSSSSNSKFQFYRKITMHLYFMASSVCWRMCSVILRKSWKVRVYIEVRLTTWCLIKGDVNIATSYCYFDRRDSSISLIQVNQRWWNL